ncbi:MAG: aminotransferase class V-fold PLP-dependent enzyme [Planctomycetota bacterium]
MVTAPTEHKATLDTAKRLVARGARLTMLAVDGEGRIDLGELADVITGPETVVSLMHANNEIGVLHPIEAIGALCRERGALFHCDAAQSFGKLPIDAAKAGIDLLSLSAHKLYGPKGVGALFVGPRVPGLEEQIHGGGHEGGRRSGTLNVPGLVGLGEATRLAVADQDEERERLLGLRDRLLERLRAELDDFRVNGPLDDRIEGNLNLSFGGVDPALLLLAIPDLALSSGSACNSDTVEPSYVLTAIGREGTEAAAALRFGIGRFTTPEEIERAADAVVAGVRGLREMAG